MLLSVGALSSGAILVLSWRLPEGAFSVEQIRQLAGLPVNQPSGHATGTGETRYRESLDKTIGASGLASKLTKDYQLREQEKQAEKTSNGREKIAPWEKCGTFGVVGTCANGHRFLKQVFCGQVFRMISLNYGELER